MRPGGPGTRSPACTRWRAPRAGASLDRRNKGGALTAIGTKKQGGATPTALDRRAREGIAARVVSRHILRERIRAHPLALPRGDVVASSALLGPDVQSRG